MRINYKEPYWVKFQWEMDSHHENQYVTDFNKVDNELCKSFQNLDEYIITVNFKVPKDYQTDYFSMIFGKPGKNMGLTYKKEDGSLAFEFWTKGTEGNDDKFNYISFDMTDSIEVQSGVIVTIIKNKNTFLLYKNFKLVNTITFETDLIDDYLESGLFIGCSNPGTYVPEHRYHGELDIEHFSILLNQSDIKKAKDLYQTETDLLLEKKYYDDILCFYDFKTINNLGVVYDESKNNNFLEKVPPIYIIP